MNLYAIIRRNGWRSGDGARAGGGALDARRRRGDARRHPLDPQLRARRDRGGLGTVCIYEASSPEAIRDHAARADLPVDEIVAIADTVVVRPDPAPARRSSRDGARRRVSVARRPPP